MKENMGLGQVIAARRKALSMTQEELGQKICVSKSAIAKWETNRGIPDRENLFKLSEVIGIPIQELHRLTAGETRREEGEKINITEDVISVLESYGYTVIRPK